MCIYLDETGTLRSDSDSTWTLTHGCSLKGHKAGAVMALPKMVRVLGWHVACLYVIVMWPLASLVTCQFGFFQIGRRRIAALR